MTIPTKPSVLFVCVKNGGKSQMAAGLMRQLAGDTIVIDSAGTKPGNAINQLSAEALLEVGVDITNQTPKQLTDDLIATADRVIILGRDAQVAPTDGTPVEVWDTDEPSERGIDGIERMRLVRDDIARRVESLAGQLTPSQDRLQYSTGSENRTPPTYRPELLPEDIPTLDTANPNGRPGQPNQSSVSPA